MVTRSAWARGIASAYRGDPCHVCGHDAPNIEVDEEGIVWRYCAQCDATRPIAREYPPARFDPEPDSDLPF